MRRGPRPARVADDVDRCQLVALSHRLTPDVEQAQQAQTVLPARHGHGHPVAVGEHSVVSDGSVDVLEQPVGEARGIGAHGTKSDGRLPVFAPQSLKLLDLRCGQGGAGAGRGMGEQNNPGGFLGEHTPGKGLVCAGGNERQALVL